MTEREGSALHTGCSLPQNGWWSVPFLGALLTVTVCAVYIEALAYTVDRRSLESDNLGYTVINHPRPPDVLLIHSFTFIQDATSVRPWPCAECGRYIPRVLGNHPTPASRRAERPGTLSTAAPRRPSPRPWTVATRPSHRH